jgi:DNA-binding transcriptional LysR family regulator
MGAWASEAYLEQFGVPTMDTLDRHRFIDGLSTRGFTLALEQLGHKVPDSQVPFRTDSLQTQRRAAELGWGLVGMPDYLAERTPGLKKVLGDAPESVALDIWLVARPAMRGQQLLRLVYDTLVEGLAATFDGPQPPVVQGVPAGGTGGASTSALSA